MKKLLMAFVTAALLTVCLCVPAFAVDEASSGFIPNYDVDPFLCEYFLEFAENMTFDPAIVKMAYDENDHYAVCLDCGAVGAFRYLSGDAAPHTEPDCEFCSTMVPQFGCEVIGRLPKPTSDSSAEILSSVTPLVTNAIDWVSLVANCIVSEPLLLMFVCASFVGIGIGFIKRIIHL